MSTISKSRFLDRTTAPHILTLILLAGLPALNMTIFLPSLNHMAEEFGTNYGVIQLAVSGYLATTAILQLVVGPLSDRFGRRKIVLAALGIFLIATVGAMLAPSVGIFLAFRMLQASVATGIVLSRAIVRDIVPTAQAASMIGYVTMGMALVPMLAPMIGGTLDQFFGWRASLGFVLIAGAVVMLLCYRDLGETVSGKGVSFSAQIKGYPELLTSPRFWGYSMCAAFGSGAFFALLGGASFVAGAHFGLSPVLTGFALGSPALGYGFGNFLSGRFAVRFGINKMALAGTSVASIGMGTSLLLSLIGVDQPFVFFGLCTLLGLGNGLMMPSAAAGSISVRPELAGTASGLSGAMMIGGGAGLSAWAGSLLTVETGPMPLQLLMFLVSVLGAVSILLVMRREKTLARQED
ncbi:multidrug effflux MFS transporter [Flavimaricola marinus]|uniref:Bcr/CflA family efflux transporter n=1 Tax=Flavimaricola marinus TaxID=1819565 RepID=A0A238LGI5_9RHOB|nr:multidrug effflux MFS transporter [Flavimaricola marinus]SMY08534.1 Multidrug resistance protein D [Flavimaricola marinus]